MQPSDVGVLRPGRGTALCELLGWHERPGQSGTHVHRDFRESLPPPSRLANRSREYDTQAAFWTEVRVWALCQSPNGDPAAGRPDQEDLARRDRECTHDPASS